MRTNGFSLRQNRGIPYYSCAALESLPWLRHGFSTRRGGAPDAEGGDRSLNLHLLPWDSAERVAENRRRFLDALDLPNATLVTVRQVHSDIVHVVESDFAMRNEGEGDALVTREKDMALAIKTADCFPLLIADPIHEAVGAAHSGWRGTLADIPARTVESMGQRFGSDPSKLVVALGPGIRDCCFEVGEEVVRLFARAYPEVSAARPFPGRPGKFLMDLAAVLRAQLTRAGVPPENQHDLGICTCCGTREFFSYRAEGAAAGRMMSVVAVVS